VDDCDDGFFDNLSTGVDGGENLEERQKKVFCENGCVGSVNQICW
jgi:hypothetical protein